MEHEHWLITPLRVMTLKVNGSLNSYGDGKQTVTRLSMVAHYAKLASLDVFFVVPNTTLSSRHLADGLRGHLGAENMYSINWGTYSFMRVRHVPVLGTLWGVGGSVATTHVMQWSTLPRRCQAHQV